MSGEGRARRIVTTRSGGWCETCDRRVAGEWHHRKNRSQGGRWCPSNGLHVCPPCHRWITNHPISALEPGWHLERWQTPKHSRAWLERRGWCLLGTGGEVTPLDVVRPYAHPW